MKRLWLLVLLAFSFSCAELRDVFLQQSVRQLAQFQFRLLGVENFSLAGVPLTGISSFSQISVKEGLILTRSFAQKNLPAKFTLNLAVKNPNDGTSGFANTAGTLSALPWSLYIDEKPTIRGSLAKAFTLPSGQQETVIPLDLNLNLAEFFGNQSYKDVFNLALALGGVNSSATRLRLRGQPTIDTPMGRVQYPGEIDIVEKTF